MNNKIDFNNIKKIHMTGIKGVGMTALALCFKDMGIEISGSDIEEYFVTDETLKKAGISWHKGFKESNFKLVDLLVFTAAHGGEENPEVMAAKKMNIPVMSHAQALGLLMDSKIGISVCGVGGKTTTSAMLVSIFKAAKLNPSFAVGAGGISNLEASGKYDFQGQHFIAEADEYFSSPQDKRPRFDYQNPKAMVMTNIAYDHPDVYKDIFETLKAFKNFAKKIPPNGLLVAGVDSPEVKKLIKTLNVPVQTFGMTKEAFWQIKLLWQKQGKSEFLIKPKKGKPVKISLSVPGEFNLKNAVGAFIMAKFFNIDEKTIIKGLKNFKGTKRRFELIKKINGILFFDDYAHHPCQLQATLKAVKANFKDKRIIAIFQPHTYSRTKALLKDFAKAFNSADLVIITDIYASAREQIDPNVSGEILAERIKKYNPNVFYKKSFPEAGEFLKSNVKDNDLIITLGAGDIFNWHKNLLGNIRKSKEKDIKIKKNKPLASFTSFNIGGKAEYFTLVKTKSQLVKAIKWALQKKIKFEVIGGGTNVLISDLGIKGLVIINRAQTIDKDNDLLGVESGAFTSQLVSYGLENSLSGFEYFAGLPGTIGGAVFNNSHFKDKYMADLIQKVEVYNLKQKKVKTLKRKEIKFSYDYSTFQKSKDIILKLFFKLKKGNRFKIEKIVKETIKYRNKYHPMNEKSAGCFFKNPPSNSAGFLIEKAGFKGMTVGGAQVSQKHASFILNKSNAKAKDVLKLVSLIQKKVKEKFSLRLEQEVFLKGEF